VRACASSKFWPKIVWRAKKLFLFLPFLESWYALWPGFRGGTSSHNLSTCGGHLTLYKLRHPETIRSFRLHRPEPRIRHHAFRAQGSQEAGQELRNFAAGSADADAHCERARGEGEGGRGGGIDEAGEKKGSEGCRCEVGSARVSIRGRYCYL
jgi:hypothetical protein